MNTTNHRNVMRSIYTSILILIIGGLADLHVSFGQVPAVPSPSISGWWTGDNTADDIINTNAGVLVGDATYAPGKVGAAFSMNGINSGVLVSNSPHLNFGAGEDFSMEAWIKARPVFTKEVLDIIDKRVTPNIYEAIGYSLCLDNGFLCFQLAAGNVQNYWAYPDLRDDQWHHVAVVVKRNDPQGGSLYVDGREIMVFNPTPFSGSLSNNAPLKIGYHADPNYDGYFSGLIDEVSMYNHAITSAEIRAIYLAGAAGKSYPLIDDGIPDEWRKKYFGPQYAVNPQAIATADPDQDGANNYQEYMAGTDPLDINSVFRTPVYVSTYAGSVPGGQDGYVTNATFFTPDSLGLDRLGRLWVTESYLVGWEPGQQGGNRIRVVTNNFVITVAGSDEPGLVEGPGLTARFRGPTSPTFDSFGNAYVCDRGNHRIRKIAPNGYVSTFAGSSAGFVNGLGSNAKLHTPIGLVIDRNNNLYVGDFDNICVRKVTPEGLVTTYAGTGQRGRQDGPRESATFNSPSGLAITDEGIIYVADWLNGTIRKIGTNGMVSTVVHGLSFPERVTLDYQGHILVARNGGQYADLVTPQGRVIWSLHWGYGYLDGFVSSARFQAMSSPLYMPNGNIMATDMNNHRLRIIHMAVPELLTLTPASGTEVPVMVSIHTLATNGVIHYTTDNTEPTTNSWRYTQEVVITNSCTFKARVFVKNYPVSDVVSASYVIRFPNDGISAEWRIRYFGSLSQNDPRIAANADPDNDGANNYQEFQAHTDPLDINSKPVTLTPLVTFNPGEGEFTNYVGVALATEVPHGTIRYWVDDLTQADESRPTNTYGAVIELDKMSEISALVFINSFPISPVYNATYKRVYALNDGIPNDWRELYFGSGYRTDPRVSAGADPDGDGAINLAEYLASTDPTDPQSVLRISNVRMVPVVTWNSVSNKLYRLLRRDDINSDEWIPLTPLVRATNITSSFTDYSATNSKAFYWVEPVMP